ncbi:MAG: hemerythrin domain-containing protein [Burkholderiales bacterium]|nr:hemerythrin domain-containing protein [Burkholderiales bacterium]
MQQITTPYKIKWQWHDKALDNNTGIWHPDCSAFQYRINFQNFLKLMGNDMKKRGFLSWLFGNMSRAESKVESSPLSLSGHHLAQPRIYYDGTLVGKLKEDHIELLSLFGKIKDASKGGNYVMLPGLLASLRLALQTHLMLENVKFYAYMRQHFAGDNDLSNFVDGVKKEMDYIARTVVRFANTYNTQAIIKERVVEFKKELDEIGNILLKRIDLEEARLYILYSPSCQQE